MHTKYELRVAQINLDRIAVNAEGDLAVFCDVMPHLTYSRPCFSSPRGSTNSFDMSRKIDCSANYITS